MSRDLAGARIAVVGASGALGSRIARLLTERGATVVPVVRDPSTLTGTGLAEPVVGDITDASLGDTLLTAVQATGERRLDGLVNASGVVAFGDLVDTPDEVIEHLFLTNVVGPLWLLRRVLPLLGESGGFVAQISGVIAQAPQPGMTAYSASKAALAGAATALVREVRRAGVQVIDLRPPHTETGLADRPLSGAAPRLPQGADPDAVAERIVAAIEAGERVVAPEDFPGGPKR